MGHINFDKGKRNWIGFYLALAICLVAVGGVAVATYVNTGIDKANSSKKTTIATTTTTAKPVENVVTNIPDNRTTQSAAPTTASKTTAATKAADLYILPLTNEVIRPFSSSQPVYYTVMDFWATHNGVDFKGKENQAIKAIADGKVVSIEKDNLRWGNIVTIDHGYGVVSIYCGVTVSSTLKVNDTVKVGDAIGILGTIPCESDEGPHLHLEMKKNNAYVDPIKAIGLTVKYSTTTTTTTTTTASTTTTTKAK